MVGGSLAASPWNENTYALRGTLWYLSPITENQLENRMGNEMEAGLVCWLIRLRISQSWGSLLLRCAHEPALALASRKQRK